MAEKKTGSIRFDDFINAVHTDPANVQPRILLSGFVGRSDTEGNIRIYSDPGLSQWVEAPAEAVVHSAPIADSPLGGSHVWLDASAELKPGIAGAAAAAAGAEGGGGVAAMAGQAVGGIGGGGGIFDPFGGAGVGTLDVRCFPNQTVDFPCGQGTIPHTIQPPTICCATLGPPCPPRPTQTPGCTFFAPCTVVTRPAICWPTIQAPCPTRTFICPPSVHAVACPPTRDFRCENVQVPVDLPGSLGCPPQGGFGGGHVMAAAAAPTQGFGCPNTSTCAPQTNFPGCGNSLTCTPQTHMLGCPGTSTCPPGGANNTTATVCTQIGCGPQTHMLGCPPTSTCPPQTHMLGCPATTSCPPQTHMLGCPPTSTCPPGGQFPTFPPMCPMTGPTICPPSIGCPTQMVGCPGTSTCTPGGQAMHPMMAQTFPTITLVPFTAIC